jgi:hypothetical protein
MTIRVSKPEFNLREKLSELEFFKLPYHKIPDGTVCQRRYYFLPSSGGAENETTSTSFADASYFIHTFTPRFVDSLIMIEWTTNIKRNKNDSRYHTIRLVRVNPDDTSTNIEYDNSGLFFEGANNANTLSSQNIYSHIFLREIDTPNTTEEITYKLQHKSSNSDTTVRLGENGHNRRLSCTITEIKGLADFYTKRFY